MKSALGLSLCGWSAALLFSALRHGLALGAAYTAASYNKSKVI
jgi:hypothetical protein